MATAAAKAKKLVEKKDEEKKATQSKSAELVFGVAHIYASFNDTFVVSYFLFYNLLSPSIVAFQAAYSYRPALPYSAHHRPLGPRNRRQGYW
jgi:hypothetical protein